MTEDEKRIWEASHLYYREFEHQNSLLHAFKAGIAWRDANPSPKVQSLLEALNGSTYTSIRETLALMAEGEGNNSEVYRQMSKGALVKLDAALAQFRGEK